MKSELSWTRRIAKDGVFLALLCVIGMFSIPMGDNVKVSLQLYAVILICFLADSFFDATLITGCYLLLGLFMPIYAGFNAGISPTFGYVIGFVLASPVFYFLNRIPIHPIPRLILAALSGTLVVYTAGTVFMMAYLSWGLGQTLLVSIVPYLPFDAVKIALAIITYLALPSFLRQDPKKPSASDNEQK